MNNFWDNKPKPQARPWEQPPVEIDEQAIEALQEDPNTDIYEEEEENDLFLMQDVNLRLEQGRLYQMVLQGDIFADTNADPRAIKNVQREIRKFVKERMETMVGIRQEQPKAQIVSSPFNDMEVQALKMVASKVTKGASESANQTPQAPQPIAAPKKDGISSISGNVKPQSTAPLAHKQVQSQPKPPQKAPKSAIKTLESNLTKPIEEMTAEEKAEHDRQAQERSKRNYAAMPANLVPHPTPQALEMMYTMAAGNKVIANPWRANGPQ